MLRFPNCKINIGLYITARRTDGYHDLETVFFPLPLKDALEIVPATPTTLHPSGRNVAGGTADNLVLKAYDLLCELYPGKLSPLDIYLHKTIPMGAGLGGGSADASFMLCMLNDFFGLNLSSEHLARHALTLGSDCPFFIYNTPQFARGRGEMLEPVAIDLSGYDLQLVCPQLHVSTASAFSMIKPQSAKFDLRDLPGLPLPDWKENVSNDFEKPVFAQHPALADLKDQLYTQGALYAAMTGSGSALYGIFKRGDRAKLRSDLPFGDYLLSL